MRLEEYEECIIVILKDFCIYIENNFINIDNKKEITIWYDSRPTIYMLTTRKMKLINFSYH